MTIITYKTAIRLYVLKVEKSICRWYNEVLKEAMKKPRIRKKYKWKVTK